MSATRGAEEPPNDDGDEVLCQECQYAIDESHPGEICVHCEGQFHLSPCLDKHCREWPCPGYEFQCGVCDRTQKPGQPSTQCLSCKQSFHPACHLAHIPCGQFWRERALSTTDRDKTGTVPTASEQAGTARAREAGAAARATEGNDYGPHNSGSSTVGAPSATDSKLSAVQIVKPKEADSITLPPFPSDGRGLRSFQEKVESAVTAASGLGNDCYQWIHTVAKDTTTYEQLRSTDYKSSLDAKLKAALTKNKPGEGTVLGRELRKREEESKRIHELPLTGRQMLWTIYDMVKMDPEDAKMIDEA